MWNARFLEWAFWNLAVCGFWAFRLAVVPDAWPMLFLVLPLQIGANIFLRYLFQLSRLSALVSLGTIGSFTEWLLVAHYRILVFTLFGLLPLSRVLWLIWADLEGLLLRGHNGTEE